MPSAAQVGPISLSSGFMPTSNGSREVLIERMSEAMASSSRAPHTLLWLRVESSAHSNESSTHSNWCADAMADGQLRRFARRWLARRFVEARHRPTR